MYSFCDIISGVPKQRTLVGALNRGSIDDIPKVLQPYNHSHRLNRIEEGSLYVGDVLYTKTYVLESKDPQSLGFKRVTTISTYRP